MYVAVAGQRVKKDLGQEQACIITTDVSMQKMACEHICTFTDRAIDIMHM